MGNPLDQKIIGVKKKLIEAGDDFFLSCVENLLSVSGPGKTAVLKIDAEENKSQNSKIANVASAVAY
jgi:hypothetical protein